MVRSWQEVVTMSETERKMQETEPDAASESVRGYDEEAIRRGADNFILRIADAARRQMALGRPLDLPELSRHLKGIEPLPLPKPQSVDRAVADKKLYREQRKAKAREKRQIENRQPISGDDRPVPIGKMARRYGYDPQTLRDYAREGRFSSKQNQKHQHITVGERSFTQWHLRGQDTKSALALLAEGEPFTREQEQLIDAHYAKKKSRTL
jgi:hypothetical protein